MIANGEISDVGTVYDVPLMMSDACSATPYVADWSCNERNELQFTIQDFIEASYMSSKFEREDRSICDADISCMRGKIENRSAFHRNSTYRDHRQGDFGRQHHPDPSGASSSSQWDDTVYRQRLALTNYRYHRLSGYSGLGSFHLLEGRQTRIQPGVRV